MAMSLGHGGLRQEDCKFKASLGYIARSCLKKRKGEGGTMRERRKDREGGQARGMKGRKKRRREGGMKREKRREGGKEKRKLALWSLAILY